MFMSLSIDELPRLMQPVHTIAVVGLSPKPERPSYRVAAALQKWGYRIVPVHPALDQLLGERAYPNLDAIPFPVDLADVFLHPDRINPVIDACIRLGLPGVWLQDGVVNPSAAARAQAAGLWVVMDRCLYRDHVTGLIPLRNNYG